MVGQLSLLSPVFFIGCASGFFSDALVCCGLHMCSCTLFGVGFDFECVFLCVQTICFECVLAIILNFVC